MIECGIVNKEGKFNEKFVEIKNFKQSFEIKIDEKYSKIEFNNRKISKELEKNLCFILLKISENTLNDKKKEIKDEIYSQLENFMQSLIERILDILENKINEKNEKFLNKIDEKKK